MSSWSRESRSSDFRQDHVEAVLQPIGDQFLNVGPQKRCSRDRPVRVAVNNGPALALGTDAAKPKLVLNRGIALIVGRITGVERSSLETASLFAETFAGGALLFCFNEFAGSLSGAFGRVPEDEDRASTDHRSAWCRME